MRIFSKFYSWVKETVIAGSSINTITKIINDFCISMNVTLNVNGVTCDFDLIVQVAENNYIVDILISPNNMEFDYWHEWYDKLQNNLIHCQPEKLLNNGNICKIDFFSTVSIEKPVARFNIDDVNEFLNFSNNQYVLHNIFRLAHEESDSLFLPENKINVINFISSILSTNNANVQCSATSVLLKLSSIEDGDYIATMSDSEIPLQLMRIIFSICDSDINALTRVFACSVLTRICEKFGKFKLIIRNCVTNNDYATVIAKAHNYVLSTYIYNLKEVVESI